MIRGGREGHDRLRILARARWPDTADLLARAGVRPGMRCLDLGCGGGEVTFELARLVGAQGHVTGVDMDEVKLSLARATAAERGLTNVEFRAGNVNDWDEPAGLDLVYCRFLLQHIDARSNRRGNRRRGACLHRRGQRRPRRPRSVQD